MPPRGAGCDGKPQIYTPNVFWVSKTTAVSRTRQVQPAVLFQRMLGVKSNGNDSSPGPVPAQIHWLFPAARALGDPCGGRVRTCMDMVSERFVSEKNAIVNTSCHGFWMAISRKYNGLMGWTVRGCACVCLAPVSYMSTSITDVNQTIFQNSVENALIIPIKLQNC